jgi:pantoate--beta-alanine ligase
MILITKTALLIQHLQKHKRKGLTIGFVPTMGALHPGHLSLIEASKKQDQLTVASIFVNPVQFNNSKDFEKYPITLENDIELLAKAGCDIVFHPTVEEIYPGGLPESEHFDLGYLESILEGKYRPGHFQGVCKVMFRLLNIVKPQQLFMGQKDYQQCMVVKKLIQIMRSDIQLIECPTLREPDGLAMSSRNLRLSKEERQHANGIWQALQYLKEHIHTGEISSFINYSKLILGEKKFNIDYIEIADAITLQLLTHWDGKQKIVALIAAFQNEVRLIDNLLLN